ncbi:Uma2 family endonuclease [Nonomuraea sp. NPDC050790]|uniref:Uma2 family endonuclease n=1 Tax=Nonomuraea sp. NPDC050790 TaxID=3364371 RepID=UPI00379B5F87
MRVARDWQVGPCTVEDLSDQERFDPEAGIWEMVEGWPAMSLWHRASHSYLLDNLSAALRDAVRTAGLDAKVGNYRVAVPDSRRNSRIPDLVILDGAAAREARDTNALTVTGDDVLLAVEVVSAEDAARDHVEKVRDYARAGIGHYWIVDLDPTPGITLLRLEGDSYTLADKVEGDVDLSVTEPLPVTLNPHTLAND